MTLHWGPRSGRVVVMGFGKTGYTLTLKLTACTLKKLGFRSWKMILSFWDDFSERCYDMLCLLQGWVLYTTKSYLLVIYITNTFIGLPQRHACDVVSYVSMGVYPDIFITHRHFESTQPVQKHMGLPVWIYHPRCPKPNKLSTAGNHWFPLVPMRCWCKLILHRFTQMLCQGHPPSPHWMLAGWDPTIDKFPSVAWRLFWCGDDPP